MKITYLFKKKERAVKDPITGLKIVVYDFKIDFDPKTFNGRSNHMRLFEVLNQSNLSAAIVIGYDPDLMSMITSGISLPYLVRLRTCLVIR